MRRLAAIIIAVVSFLTPAAAATLHSGDLMSSEAVLRWINAYRAKPDLAGVPAAVRALSRHGAFKNPETAGVYVGFIAGIIGSHPNQAERLVAKIFPLPAQDHWVIVRAIAYSGLPQWKDLLRKVADRMPGRKVMIVKYLAGKLPTLDQLAFDEKPGLLATLRTYLTVDGSLSGKRAVLEPSPDVIDTLWGYYFATGSYHPIGRIIVMLPWTKEDDNVEKLTLGHMAKYTLASNAARDARLLAMLKSASRHQPKKVAPILKDVIDAAETVETAPIRKQARAAIADLTRKGPGSRRKVAWWGQVGQGALALGCIGAAVTGHVEFGIPCVVGGAVSSAALRFWTVQD